MTPRVLVFHPALPPYRVDLFNALAARCEFRVVFLRENLLSQSFDQAELRRRLVADHGYLRDGFTLLKRTIRWGLQREIRRFAPDVVVTQEFSPTTLAVLGGPALRRRRYAHVVWTDDNPASVGRDSRLRGLARKLVLPRIDGLIVLSDQTARMYREHYGFRSPIGVSPILRDETAFRGHLSQASNAAIRIVHLHRLAGKKILLYVGRLAPEKQVHLLINAFAEIHRDVPATVLALVGDGPERPALERLTHASGVADETIFAGRLEGEDLHAWYRIGSVFGITSSYEPFGAVVNEALLAGIPVVCSTQVGARGLVDEGVSGSIVHTASPRTLAAALQAWIGTAASVDASQVLALRAPLMSMSFQTAVDGFLAPVAIACQDALKLRAAPSTPGSEWT